MSSAYHPQSDDQTEIVNKALQQYLRCFVHQQPKQWGKYLPWIEWHYNTTTHDSTGFSPFQVVFGKPPPTLQQYVEGSSTTEAVQSELMTRDAILHKLKQKLRKAQETMKEFADKRRIPYPFKMGDLVFVKLQPHRQVYVAGHRVNKLAKRYYGPFQILCSIGDVAFQLALPATSRIHPVFHASQLKPCFGETLPSLDLPPTSINNQPILVPTAIVAHQTVDNEDKVLVQ